MRPQPVVLFLTAVLAAAGCGPSAPTAAPAPAPAPGALPPEVEFDPAAAADKHKKAKK